MRILSQDVSQERSGATCRPTIIAEQKVVIYAVNCHRPQVLPLPDKFERLVRRVQQPLRLERLQINDLEALRAPNAHPRVEVVY
jgi:hypothetical protein